MSLPRPNGRGGKDRIVVPCGKCPACLSNRRDMWSIRLLEESKCHDFSIFLTLTYNDENLPYADITPSLCKGDVQKFLKLFRKSYARKVRYYCVGEYGSDTYRPHYHLIMFGVDSSAVSLILKCWGKGHICIGTVTPQSISYVAKYHVNKGSYPEGVEPPYVSMSLKPGIGYNYVERMRDYHDGNLDHAYYSDYQFKKALPRYFKSKLYSQEEREELSSRYVDSSYDPAIMDNNPNYAKDRYYRIKAFERNFKNKSKLNQKL